MRAVAALAVALAAASAAACGSAAPDLFVVTRSGSVPGAALRLLVSDGGSITCNGRARRMSEAELLEARQLQRDLEKPASEAVVLAPGGASVFTYSVRTPGGSLRFSDDSRGDQPAFLHLAAFVRELARGRCGLAR